MLLRKQTYNTLLILVFILFPISSNAQPPDLCSPYHLPLKQIQVGKINQKNISNFMNWVWGLPTSKERSSIAGKEGRTQCWKVGDWTNATCMEPLKIFEKSVDGNNYIFLITTDYGSYGEVCWSPGEEHCNKFSGGPSAFGTSGVGSFLFKRVSDNLIESIGYSGALELNGSIGFEDVNLERNGANSYVWTIKDSYIWEGYLGTSLNLLSTLDSSQCPHEIARFTTDLNNGGVSDKRINIGKVTYKFLKNKKKHYDLELKYYCADVRRKNINQEISDKFLEYQATFISKYSNVNSQYKLSESGEHTYTDQIGWFSRRSRCPVKRFR